MKRAFHYIIPITIFAVCIDIHGAYTMYVDIHATFISNSNGYKCTLKLTVKGAFHNNQHYRFLLLFSV